ncbi:MAG: hypothetical protein K1X89_19070 [Myxococcaceae bacterium]|nr:hypothetical protein [Myxococcaceae bacterium]
MKDDSRQLELTLRPRLRVIQGEGQRKDEPLESRDAVARVLMETGADLLLRRISPERAQEVEERVDEVLRLFDRADKHPAALADLKLKLDELELLVRETRAARRRRAR